MSPSNPPDSTLPLCAPPNFCQQSLRVSSPSCTGALLMDLPLLLGDHPRIPPLLSFSYYILFLRLVTGVFVFFDCLFPVSLFLDKKVLFFILLERGQVISCPSTCFFSPSLFSPFLFFPVSCPRPMRALPNPTGSPPPPQEHSTSPNPKPFSSAICVPLSSAFPSFLSPTPLLTLSAAPPPLFQAPSPCFPATKGNGDPPFPT